MDATKDYYAILGVLPSVDQEVLQAVYRTLAKKHHPDTGSGAGSDGASFIVIQEAYEILRNPASRRRYDELRKTRHEHAGRFDQASESQTSDESRPDDIDEAWEIIREYEHGVASEEQRLNLLSPSLALVFRSIMMTSRDFRAASKVANKLEVEFLSTYFGDDKEIQAFARRLLAPGRGRARRDAARELNRVIRALRNPSDPDAVIRRITEKYGLHDVAPSARKRIPNTRDGWSMVIKAAEARGWRYSGGLFSVKFFNEAANRWISPNSPEDAWTQMGLDDR